MTHQRICLHLQISCLILTDQNGNFLFSDSYKILLSEPGYSDKNEISVSTDNLDGSTMRHTIENLKPCTPYTFQIVPTGDSGEEISNTNEESFSTTNGEPQAPTGIQVDPSQR